MDNKPKSFWNKILDWIRSIFFNKELELTILGLQNAGKSTLVNVIANNKFDEDSIPTIGFNFRKMKKGKVEFKMWDLGNQTLNLKVVSLDLETVGRNIVEQLMQSYT